MDKLREEAVEAIADEVVAETAVEEAEVVDEGTLGVVSSTSAIKR